MTRRTFVALAGLAAVRPARARVSPIETISSQPEFYHGWPTLLRRSNGELLVGCSGGREAHVCPFGRVELIRYSDDGRTWRHEMFPPEELWPGFASGGVRRYPRLGDISARSALAVHRGTAHPSPIARPVLVLGVDAPGAGHAALHDMMVTQDYYYATPPEVRRHMVWRVVDELQPIVQKHDIEGLVMG